MDKKEKTNKRLEDLLNQVKDYSNRFLGYPVNISYDYTPLLEFLKYSLNNVGDPFVESIYKVNSRDIEKEVLLFFADLYKIPQENFWGYITSGGTEGNTQGIFIGRERFPNAIFYYSKDAHYSIPKIGRLLNMECETINSLENGEIDYDDFEGRIKINRYKPVVINVNIGTTMKGAIDDVDKIVEILERNGIKDYHIHCDAALFGMILPYAENSPEINFKKPIDSMAISGHKFIGSPIPSGITLTKKEYIKKVEQKVEYIGTLDTTISGSRNGFTPLILWYAIQTRGIEGFKKEVKTCFENTQYLKEKLDELNIPNMVNKFSNTVVFRKPSDELVEKWQLAIQGDWAHIIVMQHVTKESIDKFMKDLRTCSKSRVAL